ncbi:MAG: hypothetical protein V2A56_13010 [bacterium]
MRRNHRRWLLGAALIIGVVVLYGCGSNSVTGDKEEGDHLDALGVRVMDGDTQLVQADGTDVTGMFACVVGDTTEWLSLLFKNDAGTWFDPSEADSVEEVDADHGLVVRFTDPLAEAIVGTFTDGTKWHFRVAGVTEGETTARIVITHHDHDDYVSPELPVSVAAAP